MRRHFPALALVALSVLVIGVISLETTNGEFNGPLNISATTPAPPTTTPPPTTPPVRFVPVSPSIDATGQTDVSVRMAAFFASVRDGSVVQFPATAKYRMDQTLVLAGRHNLAILANGAQFFAVSTGTSNRSAVRIQNSSGILFSNLLVRGPNPNAGLLNAAYVPALEHQHGFEMLSATNVVLSNVTATDVYGDFVYIGKMPNGVWSSGVSVLDSHFARNGRQGVSITAGRNVTIARNTMTDVRATAFDFEPPPADGVDGVTVADNTIGATRALFVAANGHGPVNNITVSTNHLNGPALSVWAESTTPGLRNGWKVFANTSNANFGTPTGNLMRFTGANGVTVHDNRVTFQPGRNMVVASVTNSCNVVVAGNVRPGSVGEDRVAGHC